MKRTYILLTIITSIMCACNQSNRTAAGRYAGRDISGKAEIIKDPAANSTKIRIDVNGPWKLYAGSSVDSIEFSRTVAGGEAAGVYDVAVPAGERAYYQLTTNNGKAILSERLLPMEGGYNFRDLGGYRTASGHYVKWGKLFRTDGMDALTPSDLDYLSSIPLRTVVDFRSGHEIDEAPDRVPQSVVNRIELSISAGDLTDIGRLMQMDSAQTERFMVEMSASLVSDSLSIMQFREFFRILQDESHLPLAFHCTAGKDRTGTAAALFLSALGVDEGTIVEDYLLSNRYLKDKYADVVEKYPKLGPMMRVDAKYIRAVFDRIRQEHGSVNGFLENILEVDTAKMRKIYLYR